MSTRSKEDFLVQCLQACDAILTFLAFWVAWDLRDLIRIWLGLGIEPLDVRESIQWVLYITVPFSPLLLERFGFYKRLRTKRAHQAFGQLFKGLLVMGLIVAVFALLAKYPDARRLVVTIGFGLTGMLLFLRDRITCRYLRKRSIRDEAREPILLVGLPDETRQLLTELEYEITDSWKVVEHFDLGRRDTIELFELIRTHSVERVVFATKGIDFDKVASAVEACELQGVEAWIAASFMRGQIARPMFDAIGDKPMLVLRSTPSLSWELMTKELMDRVGAACIILASLPLWIFAWVGIRMTSPGAPVLFCQKRAGRYGKPFRMWKFRTMVPNAEELLEQIKNDHGNEMNGPVFKLDKDPRVFPFGAMLRKLSIDELPQLINVLRGDMSLVGPRPLPLYEVDAISDMAHRRRLSVKPGITCEWQVSGRNQICSFEQWVELDLRYIDNWSLWLDLSILARTIPAVLLRKGAK